MPVPFRDVVHFTFNDGRGLHPDQLSDIEVLIERVLKNPTLTLTVEEKATFLRAMGTAQVPAGAVDNDVPRWDTTQGRWIATQPVGSDREHPYFVLTRNPDAAELKAALDFHLENPPVTGFTFPRTYLNTPSSQIQAGQPFRVEGGFNDGQLISEATGPKRDQ